MFDLGLEANKVCVKTLRVTSRQQLTLISWQGYSEESSASLLESIGQYQLHLCSYGHMLACRSKGEAQEDVSDADIDAKKQRSKDKKKRKKDAKAAKAPSGPSNADEAQAIRSIMGKNCTAYS